VGIPLCVVAGEIVPHCAAEQDTLQTTPPLLASFDTIPVRRAVEPVGTVAVVGETDTAVAGGGQDEIEGPPPQPTTLMQTTAVNSAPTRRKQSLAVMGDAALREILCFHFELCRRRFIFVAAISTATVS
jgi:hypothetical protein